MKRLKFWDYATFCFFGVVAVVMCFFIDALARDYVATVRSRNRPVSRQEPRTRVPATIQGIYVYRAEDVAAVLQAARAGLPELAGAEGVGR